MKKRLLAALLTLAMGVLTMASVSAYAAQLSYSEQNEYGNITQNETADTIPAYATTGVNLRSGPGTKYGIVGGLNRGDKVERLGTEGKWTLVRYNEMDCYVYSKYLSDTDLRTLATCPIVKTAKVRSSLGSKYKTLGRIKKGTMAYVKSTTTVNGKDWLEVFYEGKWGYISADCANINITSNPTTDKVIRAVEDSKYFVHNSSIYLGMFGDRNAQGIVNVRVTQNADFDRLGKDLRSILSSIPGAKVQVRKSKMPSYANLAYIDALGNKIGEKYSAAPADIKAKLQLSCWGYDVVNDTYTVHVVDLDPERARLFKQYISDWEYIRLESAAGLIPKT